MEKLNIIFIGGMPNGYVVYDYLKKNKYVNLCLVITYPDDSLYPRAVKFPDEVNILKSGSANNKADLISEINPDYIFVAGWSELLDTRILTSSKKGVIGFHPSKLPMDRGRSVIAWQIEDGYTETALSMFYYNDFPDGGDIIAQEIIKIEQNDYIIDILEKVKFATTNLMCSNFQLLRQNKAPRKPQDLNEGNFRRLRTNTDSQINWNSNAQNIYNKIRAISFPYPSAEGIINHNKYKIHKANVMTSFPFGNHLSPGQIVATLYDDSLIIKCRDFFLKITNYELMKS